MIDPTNNATEQPDRFDPNTSCDEMERMMIAMMRSYLRPECAPECMYERIRKTLDQCCHGGQNCTDTSSSDESPQNNAQQTADAQSGESNPSARAQVRAYQVTTNATLSSNTLVSKTTIVTRRTQI